MRPKARRFSPRGAAPWKALHLAGGYGQIHYRAIYNAPGHSPRAQTVEITKA
jgi:ethylbenzene hydroxylase subunit alpha/complex iron-sulfur molybdoenzyme family reductase subunit alpha